MKGRYYGDTNFLNAKVCSKASYIWKSLIHGRDLLRQGLRFVIGDGSLIDVWADLWLPTHPPRPPIPRLHFDENIMVADWIYETKTGWNEEIVHALVTEEDANIIMSIRLCSKATTYLLGWH